jgi:NADPH-dependent curcumin reductase CurA
MASRIGQEIRLKQYPKGMPTKDIFQLAKVDVPETKEGEFLVRNIWMSVDPYMRGRMRSPQETKSYISSFQLNRPLDGACVRQIIESKNNKFVVGEYVLGNFGWREYWLSNGNDILIHYYCYYYIVDNYFLSVFYPYQDMLHTNSMYHKTNIGRDRER